MKDTKVKNGKEVYELQDLIKSLTTKGKKKGNLTYKELIDTLENVELETEDIDKLYEQDRKSVV